MPHRCPHCGQEDPVVPVWESRLLHDRGMPPKFIGCLECGEMK